MRLGWGGILGLAALLCAAALRADTPPGQASLSAQLEGYGAVSMTASAAQGSNALSTISVTADVGSGPVWLANLAPGVPGTANLPACGSLTLSAQAVDVLGETGASSPDLDVVAPCGPDIASFAPAPSTATGEILSWNAVPGQDSAAYILAASAGSASGAADPLPLLLTVTSQTSYTYTFTTGSSGTASENLFYRVYAVDQNGVTSTAASCCQDSAYSFAIPPIQSYAASGNVTFTASWGGGFSSSGPSAPLLYTLYGSPSTSPASFVALGSVTLAAADLSLGASLSLPVQEGDAFFYLSVSDGAVASSLSPPACDLLYAPALATPAAASASVSASGVQLSWAPVPEATGYNVLRTDVVPAAAISGGSAGNPAYNAKTGLWSYTDSQSYASGALSSTGPLSYAIQAASALPATVTGEDAGALGPSVASNNPGGLQPPLLTALATGSHGIVALTWSQVPAAAGYEVYYSTSDAQPLGPGVTSTAFPASVTAALIGSFPSGSPLQDGVLTWFWIATSNGSGPGPFSQASSALPYTAPLAPTLSASVLPYGQGLALSVSLPASPDVALAQLLLYSSLNKVTPLAALDPEAPALTLSASAYPCGTPLTLTVQAVDIQGDTGPPSAGVWLEAPCAPAVSATALGGGGSLGLAWSQPAGGAGDSYVVSEATGQGWPDPQPTRLTLTSALTFSAPPAPGETLWYSVTAVDRFGVSSAAATQVALLEPPSGLQAVPGSGQVALTWSAPPAADAVGQAGYTVYYSDLTPYAAGGLPLGPGPGVSSVTVSSQASSQSLAGLTITGLSDFTPYAFAVASSGGTALAVSGGASGSLTATTGLEGAQISSVATDPALGTSVVFSPLTLTGSGDALIPAPGPTATLLAQWTLGSYLTSTSSVATLYEATDLTSSPQTFNSLTPVATAPASALFVSLSAGAPGPAWYFLNISDAAHPVTVDDGADTSNPDAVAAAFFAPNLSSTALSLLPPVSNGRVQLSWAPVPFADSYVVYRATQDVPAVGASGLTYSALATSATPATFGEVGTVLQDPDGGGANLVFTDSNPVENSRNAYEVVAALSLSGGARVFGPAGNAVTRTPWVAPEEPGFWQWPGGNDGSVAAETTGGDTAGISGNYLTAAATSDPSGGVLVEWSPSGGGSNPLSYYNVFRGESAQGLVLLTTVAASLTAGPSTLVSYLDTAPPLPLAGLVYGVSAVDVRGYGSVTVTGTVQPPLLWPAPNFLANPGLAGLCGGNYCSGSNAVTFTWAPGANLEASALNSGTYLTVSAGTFPFKQWLIERVAAPGAAPQILAGPGSPTALSVAAGSLSGLTQTTATDWSPVPGTPAYLVAVVDTQGNVGAAQGLSVSVTVPSYRTVPLAVTGLSAAPAVLSALTSTGSAGLVNVLGAALSWTPNAAQDNVGAYAVFREDPGAGGGAFNLVTETTLCAFTDAAGVNDPAGSEVTYTVEAVSNDGLSSTASAPLDFVLAPPAPASMCLTADIPAGVSLSPAVGLSWPDVLQLKSAPFFGGQAYSGSYTVYRSDNPAAPLPGCVGLSGPTCADTAPIAQASYQVESLVTNQGGGSVASAGLSAPLSVTFSAVTPLAPTSLSASATATGVALTWSPAPNSGAYEYWIYRSSSPLTAQPPYAAYLTRVVGTSFTDAGLLATAGLTYSTQVEPYYAVAPAAPWVLGSALTVSASIAPPTVLAALAGATGQAPDVSATVSLSWQAAASAVVTGYNVWRSSPGQAKTFLAAVTGTGYTDVLENSSAGLTNTVLTYSVMSEGLGQSGICSSPVTVTAYGLPRAPLGLQGEGLADGAYATWKPAYASQGVTGYALAWTFYNGGGSGETLTAASPTEWTLEGLIPGQSLALSVQALNSAGASPWSSPIALTVSALGPPAPPLAFSAATGLVAGAVAPASCAVVLNVSATTQNGFVVYRSPALGAALPAQPRAWAPLRLSDCAGGASSPYYLTTLPGTLGSLTDTAVSPGYRYSYAVTALGPLGLPTEESLPLAASPTALAAYNAWAPPALSGTAGNAQVNLAWAAPGAGGEGTYALSGFMLYRQTQGNQGVDSGFPLLFSASQTAYADFQVQNVQPGSSLGYTYWMTCLDSGGNQSQSATTGTFSPMGPLAPPSNLTAVAGNLPSPLQNNGEGVIQLQWFVPQSDVFSGAVYNVYRRALTGTGSSYGPPLPNLFHVGPNLASYGDAVSIQTETVDDDTAPYLVTECYTIAAVDGSGEGPKSQEVRATAFKQLDPSADGWGVENWTTPAVTINDGNQSSIITVVLTWNEIPQTGNAGNGGYTVGGYLISRSQNGGATYTTLATVPETAGATTANQLNYVDTVAKGQAYVYLIQPIDSAGNLGLPYDLKTVQIPSGQNALYVYRNSFDPMTGGSVNLQVGLQQSGNFWVKIYTLNGEYVATIIPTTYSWGQSASPYLSTVYTWNGTNSRGQTVASGVYLIHLQGPGFSTDARVAVIK